jgi:Metallo-peptidase family M12B Reprolysin-like
MKTLLLFISFAVTAFLPAAAQVPLLNSYPSAQATLFIDFDGQHVAGTAWNMSGDIDALPAGFSTAAVTEIVNRVAEDFRPFNLNITTDSVRYWSAPANKRMRIIVTPSSAWYGAAGGVAYAGSFIWGDNTPAWVFSALLGNRTKWVAEAISHETGHTLGLQHQSTYNSSCVKTAEYSTGQGSGEIGWAPIMGAGYYQNHTTWNIGPSTIGCGNIQNDFNIISTRNGFGLRADDHGNNNALATPISVIADAFAVNGLVNTDSDVDVFKLVVPATTWLKLNAIPHNVGAGDDGANIDIKVSLLNGSDTINTYNPSTLLNAGVDTNLNAGTYYLVVDGAGNIYHDDVGSLGLYTISGHLLSTLLPAQNLGFSGAVLNNHHQLTWTLPANQAVQQWILESSADGKQFNQLTVLPASATMYNCQPTGTAQTYYRLKMVTADGQQLISNTIILKSISDLLAGVQVTQYTSGQLTINSSADLRYALYRTSGQQIGRGTLRQGINHLSGTGMQGLLLMQCSNGKQSFTKKIIQQ